MLRFYWRWITIAFRHSFDYASIVATIISLVVAIGTWAAQKFGVKMKVLEQINEMGGWGYALAAAGVLVIGRLALAPYWIYQEEAARVEKFDAKRPRIICLTTESTATPKVTYGAANDIIVRVTVNLRLVNTGDGDAYDYKIAVYSCWFKDPDDIDKWSDDFAGRWSPRVPVDYAFAQSKEAEDIGMGKKGITSLDEIVFVVEVEAQANTPNGPSYKEEIWLCWAIDHPIRPPNSAMVNAVRPRIEKFKALPM